VTVHAIARELARDVDEYKLVCHGALIDGAPVLYLDDKGDAAPIRHRVCQTLAALSTRLVWDSGIRQSGGNGPDAKYGAGGALAMAPHWLQTPASRRSSARYGRCRP
jgi:hypothetical protein